MIVFMPFVKHYLSGSCKSLGSPLHFFLLHLLVHLLSLSLRNLAHISFYFVRLSRYLSLLHSSLPGSNSFLLFSLSKSNDPMDRDAWQATVHGVANSQTWLSDGAHICALKKPPTLKKKYPCFTPSIFWS